MEYVIVVVIAFAIGWVIAYGDTSKRERALRSQEAIARSRHERDKADLAQQRAASMAQIEEERQSLEEFRAAWTQEYQRLLGETTALHQAFDSGFLNGRKWLADAFSEYIQTHDLELECSLVLKPNPAWKAAETVSALRAKRAEMAREIKLLQYQLASYEEYFPVLVDYRDAILDEVVDLRAGADEALADVDPALGLGYLSGDEYAALASAAKFQLALDRYWERNKSNVEIGRLYERYVGYLYEQDGWVVRYHGALKGFEDFGRDLICARDGTVAIVQCKCWSRDKVIREKHVMQLFGTCILYRLSEGHSDTIPVFAATTALSDDAALVAKELGVSVRHIALERYPMVKCNINPSTGDRIYHLPFDQQYDRVIVGDQDGEFYADTVAEAEAAGFRRAQRWRGEEAEANA
ncbi:MAG: restriction endonuclease [Coriobacteriia bacterium]